ncbi:LysM peptidoglycan-binding domain-containing protein [Brevundimonas sp. BAL450]|uniref:LysM peptidoglycan-binding domain-containing protein n=1 Tax=Brevundimonas sp. BAL450 TaxID=1708162 RepID=UPI0018C986BF|nr:LysM peptidoglycan-binding domain-containing protein [Brevundimonas sp. BAL450]MBG7614635.1 LysM peptidoglycan-binding domain-containing protein [Brevundimonas sp. BAL450]
MGLFPSDRCGPAALYELSLSARRRFVEAPKSLPERRAYRPGALGRIEDALTALDPAEVGLGPGYDGLYQLYEVRPGDSVGKLAQRFYGAARHWPSLYRANPQIENPNRIYPGCVLKIPEAPWVNPQAPTPKEKPQ